MQGLEPVPQANFIPVPVTRMAPGEVPLALPVQSAGTLVPAPTKTDGFAVASAICGFVAIIPVVSQIIGLACGVIGLCRIRRARRRGVRVDGARWAVAGIISSGLALLGWIGMFAFLYLLRDNLSDSVGSLQSLLRATQ